MGKEWVKLEKIGQLYLEKILVSFDVPILFVCSDFEKRFMWQSMILKVV